VKTGYAIFAHGSKVEGANESVRTLARRFAQAGPFDLVEPCFLELAEPDLPAAVAALAGRGASEVIVLPYFLTFGRHLAEDLPRLSEQVRARFPWLSVRVAPPLDGHPALLDILVERARAVQEEANR